MKRCGPSSRSYARQRRRQSPKPGTVAVFTRQGMENMNQRTHPQLRWTRRAFLGRSGAGLGTLALASLLKPELLRADATIDRWRGVVDPLHFAPKAKRVIYLYMAGGPSHLETFDYKPKLAQMHGQPMPESFTKGQPIAQLQGAKLNCFGPQHPFIKARKAGQQISRVWPHLASGAGHLCIIRSLR